MKKKFTLLIFDAMGRPVRRAALPRHWLPITALVLTGVTIALGWGLWDYFRLKAVAGQTASLKSNLDKQRELVTLQQDQIAAFTQKVDALKIQLAELNEFERKIRIIANLEPSDDGASLFGVGGSDPSDIDPGKVLIKDHVEQVRDLHEQINAIDGDVQSQHHVFNSIFKQLEGKRNLLAATPSIRPLKGWFTSTFGYRESPFTGRREFHRGLDIAAREGSTIVSPADGVVTFAGRKGLMGYMMTIEHGFGMATRYGHLHKMLKNQGDHVKRGDPLGLVGNTGRSTGPHLHYEVRLNGLAVNPTNYFLN